MFSFYELKPDTPTPGKFLSQSIYDALSRNVQLVIRYVMILLAALCFSIDTAKDGAEDAFGASARAIRVDGHIRR